MNNNKLNKIIPYLIFPVGISTAVTLHQLMLSWNIELQFSTYAPIFFIAAVITVFEIHFPNMSEWKPDKDEVATDVIYMVFVQTLIPKILGFVTALLVLDWFKENEFTLSVYWIHQAPIWVQVIVMVLIADFLQYWFHVACHNNSLLWKFHSVHHSSERLYWLNTGKFHPLEKAAQFLFDAFPFIILGVDERVLALYFVFYAVNGFFQHSNISMKFGILNYLISTAELHRWHHSEIKTESNSNYGNNTIVWDLLFGSRYLPVKKHVGKLGLDNPCYPKKFIAQLRAPFKQSNG